MNVRDSLEIRGFVTQYKYLAGHVLKEIEALLGFGTGRLDAGATFVTLDRMPTITEFDTAGYSQVAGHRHKQPLDLDPQGLRRLAMSVWAPTGPDRLIKVIATAAADPAMSDDANYPPGLGIPQWKLTRPVPGTVVAVLQKGGDIFRLP